MKRFYFDQVGSTLPELLISLGIMLGAISAVLVLFQSSFKGLYQAEAKLQETGVLNELQLNLKNRDVCEKNFLTKAFDASGGMNLASIQDTLGNSIANVNAYDPTSALKITGIRIVTDPSVWNAFQAAKASLPATGYLLSTQLQVSFQRVRQSGTNPDTTISMALPVFIDANAKVSACLTPQSALEEAALATSCTQVGGVIDVATKTCRFSADCSTVADGKPFEAECMNQEITELKKTISVLQAQVKPSTTTKTPFANLMEQMKWCMRSLDDRTVSRFDGGKISCEFGYTFILTPTEINAFGYHITDPKIASQIFNDVASDYTDFFIKQLLEGQP